MAEEKSIKEILKEQLAILPENVVDAILASDYKVKLQEITKRNRLLIDQAGKLEMETTLVMLGLVPLSEYISNLQKEMDVPVMRATEIATDVSEHIFKPIREALRAVNEKLENGEESPSVSLDDSVKNRPKIEWGSTDTSDANLNRDQILSEIEDPSLIGQNPISSFEESTPKTEMVTNTSKTLETLDEVPYQQDIKIAEKIKIPEPEKTPVPTVSKLSLLETKMRGVTITPPQTVDAIPENKLPPIEKKRPTGGVDPYREEIK